MRKAVFLKQVAVGPAELTPQSSASARFKLRAFEGSFVIFATLPSIHFCVGVVTVVTRRFVRVQTGLVAGAILPKERLNLEGGGLAAIVGGHAFGVD